MKLIDEIIEILSPDNGKLSDDLIKTKVLLHKIGHKELVPRVNNELNGYPDRDMVPEYRILQAEVLVIADLAVKYGKEDKNLVINATGPETFTYRGLVKKIGDIIGIHRPIFTVPPGIGYLDGWIIGRIFNDVMITKEEIKGLMANLLYVDSAPAGSTKITEWAEKHSDTLDLRYTSKLARRIDRESEYKSN